MQNLPTETILVPLYDTEDMQQKAVERKECASLEEAANVEISLHGIAWPVEYHDNEAIRALAEAWYRFRPAKLDSDPKENSAYDHAKAGPPVTKTESMRRGMNKHLFDTQRALKKAARNPKKRDTAQVKEFMALGKAKGLSIEQMTKLLEDA